jgi:DNA-binding NarL/FixJ family response regulator
MKKLTKIFIAEDHPFYAKGVSNVLDNFNQFSVVGTTESASKIISNLKSLSPHILILDVNLSGYNSLDIIPEIKMTVPKIKILILSMYLPSDININNVKKDIDGYVLKNSGTEILVNALTNVSLNLKYWDPNINAENHHSKDNFAQKLKLSARELEILALLKEGLNNKKISEKLFLSEFTVKTHRKNIMGKMEVNNIVDLLKKC